MLCRNSRKLAFLAPCAGQWMFYSLPEAGSTPLLYNRQPAPTRCPIAVGDLLDLNGLELVVESVEVEQPAAISEASAAMSVPSSREIDFVYRKAKKLCQHLLPVLRESGGKLQPPETGGGLWSWLKIFRRPGNPAETLERLHFLLSGSPRDRVWLFELARFLFQQSYDGLCLQLLKELNRLYPDDEVVARTLAQLYYQQSRNSRLPAEGRLNALKYAERSTQLARRLAKDDLSLVELERAVRVEQTNLRSRLTERTPCPAFSRERADVMGRKR